MRSETVAALHTNRLLGAESSNGPAASRLYGRLSKGKSTIERYRRWETDLDQPQKSTRPSSAFWMRCWAVSGSVSRRQRSISSPAKRPKKSWRSRSERANRNGLWVADPRTGPDILPPLDSRKCQFCPFWEISLFIYQRQRKKLIRVIRNKQA